MVSTVAEKILEDADRRVREIEAAADQQARELSRDHDREATQHRKALKQDLDQAIEAESTRIAALAEVALRNDRLTRRREILDRIVARCAAVLTDDPNLYRRFLEAMAARGTRTGREEVQVSARDIDRLGPDLLARLNRAVEEKTGRAGHLTLSASPEDMGGGLRLTDGAVTFNGTLDQALRTLLDRHLETVLSTLFPAGNDPAPEGEP
ncbi:hypothetical protein JCM14469_36830 [Desulfatiferula olefinivorans]